MVIAFAADKSLKLDATSDQVVDYMDSLVEDIDIEMTPEMLAKVAGGFGTGYHRGSKKECEPPEKASEELQLFVGVDIGLN